MYVQVHCGVAAVASGKFKKSLVGRKLRGLITWSKSWLCGILTLALFSIANCANINISFRNCIVLCSVSHAHIYGGARNRTLCTEIKKNNWHQKN